MGMHSGLEFRPANIRKTTALSAVLWAMPLRHDKIRTMWTMQEGRCGTRYGGNVAHSKS